MGSTVGDFDGDGDFDWFVTSIYDDYATTPPRDGNRLFRNDGGRVFSDVTDTAGVRNGAWDWAASFVDHDNDGDRDILITNNGKHPVLYRNDGGNQNNWLRIDTVGSVSNRDGIGAVITIVPDLSNLDEFLVREVDGDDFLLWQTYFGSGGGLGAAAVPEPAALGLSVLGIAALFGSRARQRRSLNVTDFVVGVA